MGHLQMMNAMKSCFQKDEQPTSPIQMVVVLLHENQYHKTSYSSYKIVRYAEYVNVIKSLMLSFNFHIALDSKPKIKLIVQSFPLCIVAFLEDGLLYG